ncbi:uncharacterized protein GGS22DRAFT_184479 [Annulohypoxylon maeteangense]|uniref:uncharacterized protein n=1 Tax=Annulohypoxylon maeteangense TaxID=1927788 RepID=UPI0020086E85|nr:uncharacterized protein GGS22DRAFT_184479 [Annulohypoxylon maeteangense]KAI0888903.1 hypothetical protein GGS22DRAFT_184479 [Annulohypoxylon maeteangense]
MPFTSRTMAFFGLLAFMANIHIASALDMAYCATINTATTNANSSTFQSDGLCYNFCVDSFAYAVVQASDCWCTNYTPDDSTTEDTTKCSSSCPGYPSDTCGGDGLYGYMSLSKSPSGTKGSGTSSTTTKDQVTETVHNTVTVTPTASSPSSSSTVQSTTTVSVSSGTTATTATTPTVSVHTVTAGGTVSLQTVTVAPTSTTGADTAASDSSGASTSQHGLSTGAAVGVAIGVLAIVAIAVAVGVFLYLRRRRRGQGDAISDSPGSHRGSSAGMMSTPTTAMASVWDGDNTSSGRRNSRYMPHDPRMDPYAANIYSRFENKSHESINTLQDNHDYSRKVLRTTNPDPVDQE